MSNIDLNVDNYSLSELMAIVELDNLDEDNIMTNTEKYINKYEESDPELSTFFKEIQSELLQYSAGLQPDESGNTQNNENISGYGQSSNEAEYPAGQEQVEKWFENQNLRQKNSVQNEKITERKQKIDVFGNAHVPMKREQLGINNNIEVPVAQDSLNPNLKNTITRFLNLDSQFRQYSAGFENYTTDYHLDLSDTLKDTLSIRLYSYQIPFTWYVIDSAYGNTCFWISDASYNITIEIPNGNYSPTDFVNMLNRVFVNAGFVFKDINPPFPYPSVISSANLPVYYNQNNGKITMFLNGGEYKPDGVNTLFTISDKAVITFFDFTGILQCVTRCVDKTRYINQTLGWIMGYRMPYERVNPLGNIASSTLDLNGTKYLILVIDDYNQNHVNNGLVSITELSNVLKMPNYYSPDLPYTCITPQQQQSNLNLLIAGENIQSIIDGEGRVSDNGLLIAGKYENDYTSTQLFLPSAPRTLTQSQLYTINEINRNRNNNTNYRSKAPTNSDILAILPIKPVSNVGNLIVEFSGSLQDNIRVYFGPVNIERLNVKLLDDKGNILNLNGADWCVSLICECLYQY